MEKVQQGCLTHTGSQLWGGHNLFHKSNFAAGFAFIQFEDHYDAEDSVRDLDGKKLCGVHIRVQIADNRRKRYVLAMCTASSILPNQSFQRSGSS